jgi:hypothetical protein
MLDLKTPINWWRVAALAAIPLFLYSTWNYGEAQARYNHLLEHTQGPHGLTEQHPPAKPANPEPPKLPAVPPDQK